MKDEGEGLEAEETEEDPHLESTSVEDVNEETVVKDNESAVEQEKIPEDVAEEEATSEKVNEEPPEGCWDYCNVSQFSVLDLNTLQYL